MNTTKLAKTLKDAKAEGDRKHKEVVEQIKAAGLVYRDANGKMVTIPED